MITIEIDTVSDAGYIRMSDKPVASSSEFNSSIIVDLDEFDCVVGVEVLALACPLPVSNLNKQFHLSDEAIAVLRQIRPSIESLRARSAATRSTSAVRRSASHFREEAAAS